MLFSELKNKEVIDIKDCKKLGKIQDLEFDPHT
ncbi:MAG: PRC-barrel domain-containing protein, partial [Lachnospiraceae bacterium]|nr:PRC-barrel domain-containing protein [Lachnospiraceae bacterium]